MKELTVNIITNNNQYGLTSDARILVRYLQQVAESSKLFTFKVRSVSFYCSECGSADINIHLEIPCPLLVHSAALNIFVPNHEWFFQRWTPYLDLFDEVWVKHNRARQIFLDNTTLPPEKVHTIEWTSLDRNVLDVKPEVDQFLHLAGRSRLKGTQGLLDAWDPSWPTLHVVYNKESAPLRREVEQDNITYYRERLSDEDLITLMNRCGVHLCTSEEEGFGHYLNEARSCGALVITLDQDPMRQFTDSRFVLPITTEEALPHTLGVRHGFSREDLSRVITDIRGLTVDDLKIIRTSQRHGYIALGKAFRGHLEGSIKRLLPKMDYPPQPKLPNEIKTNSHSLPSITLLTILYNRPEFIPLAILNYTGTDYPKHLLKWVVVDASDDTQKPLNEAALRKELEEDMESGVVQYIKADSDNTVANNRNFGVDAATTDYVACMDDDDIYPPRHLLVKVAYLQHYRKSCGYATNIGCFHISKYISTINVPPIHHAPEARVSEATLLFKKTFWEDRPFRDEDYGGEATYFIEGRYGECVEYPWKPVLISLLHGRNLSTRVRGLGDEPNGCHFGISDELFQFITSLEKIPDKSDVAVS